MKRTKMVVYLLKVRSSTTRQNHLNNYNSFENIEQKLAGLKLQETYNNSSPTFQ